MNLRLNNGNGFRPRINRRRLIFYLATLAILVFFYFKFSEFSQLKDVFSHSNREWIYAAFLLQFFTYFFLAMNYRYVLKMKQIVVSLTELLPIAFIIQFINQAFPAVGLSGQIFFVDYLKHKGISRTDSIGRAVLEVSTLYLSFGILFLASIILILTKGLWRGRPELLVVLYAFAGVAILFTSIFFAIQYHDRFSNRFFNWFVGLFQKKGNHTSESTSEHEVRPESHIKLFFSQIKDNLSLKLLENNKKSFWLAVLWQGMVWFSNAMILWALSFALDIRLSFSMAVIAFTLTQFISMISFMPGAIGVFEGGLSVLLISFGVPGRLALTLALAFRMVTLWLPLPIGWILYKRYENKHRQLKMKLE